jgi:hypothetical protein
LEIIDRRPGGRDDVVLPLDDEERRGDLVAHKQWSTEGESPQ